MLSVILPIELERRLEELARTTGRTKTFYVKEALQAHIEDMEDRYLAFERLEHPMPTLSMLEVYDELKNMDS